MPEAPEVQTVLNYLEEQIQNVRIEKVIIRHPKLCANLDCSDFEAALKDEHFRAFHRLGKYLVFELDRHILVVHLRMEGTFVLLPSMEAFDGLEETLRRHIHALILFEDGRAAAYRDTRKFGRMYLYSRREDWKALPVFDRVGKDVLDASLSARELLKKASRRRIPIKTFLLDQSVMAGIGNIYADEILFACGISPLSRSDRLSFEDWQKILEASRSILQKAMDAGGTTIRTFSWDGIHQGSYQTQLKVHGRKEPCLCCQKPLSRIRVGGRGTWYCPNCQKEK